MSEFTVNTHRLDPYKNFKFRIQWDGRTIAGVHRVSGLRRRTDVVIHRAGNDPSTQRKSPGLTDFEPIVLERGLTHDPEFERWANKVWAFGASPESSLRDFRKDVIIDIFNEAGQRILSYHVFRCWPSEFQAVPELDANGNAVAIESLKLENEGWERDLSVTEPEEPSFDRPSS